MIDSQDRVLGARVSGSIAITTPSHKVLAALPALGRPQSRQTIVLVPTGATPDEALQSARRPIPDDEEGLPPRSGSQSSGKATRS